MKKYSKIISAVVFTLFIVPLAAVDFGLNIGNMTDVSKNVQIDLNQSNTATAWITSPIKDFSFAATVVYKFNLAWNANSQTIKPFQIDVGSLEFSGFLLLSGKSSSGLRIDAGRIQASDISGKVFSAKSDGVNLALVNKNITFGAQAYYTGLTLIQNSVVALSPQDKADRSSGTVIFGPPRVVYSVYGLFQEFLLRQSFNIEVLGQNDLRIGADPRVHSYYGTAVLTGPLVSALRYTLGSSFGVRQSAQKFSFGQIISLNLALRIPSIKTNFGLSGIYSMPWGAEKDGFEPVNSQSVSLIIPDLKNNNCTFIGFDAAWQPASFFSGGLKTNVYLKQSPTAVTLPVLKADNTSLFVGAEMSVYGSFIVSSEFSFMVSSGFFLLNPFAVVKDTNILPAKVSLSATLKI